MWRKPEDRVLKFMDSVLARDIAYELNKWFDGKGKRIEFALQGEPTLNPNILEIIAEFREHYPKCQLLVSTNGDHLGFDPLGVLLSKGSKVVSVEKLFESGLNILMIEAYDGSFDEKTRIYTD